MANEHSDNRTDYENIYQEGQQLFLDRRYREAAERLETALRLRETPEAWNDWATALVAEGNLKEAEGGFRHAMALRPDDAQAGINLGVLLAQLGRRAEAVPLLEQFQPALDPAQREAVGRLLERCRHAARNEVDPSLPADPVYTVGDYSREYYEEHKATRLDYLAYGYWQASFGRMVTEALLQSTYEEPFVFDAGCACGTTLEGIRQTGVYAQARGMDISAHMVQLGRERFGFSDDELRVGSIEHLPVADETVTLLHCGQVLEHISDGIIDQVLGEFSRVLRRGGRAFFCFDAVRHGQTAEMYTFDPTHCNLQPPEYWSGKFTQAGLLFDVESYDRFVRSPHGPTDGVPDNFYQVYNSWTTFTLIKP